MDLLRQVADTVKTRDTMKTFAYNIECCRIHKILQPLNLYFLKKFYLKNYTIEN